MKIGVGSKNKTKVDAVVQMVLEYPIFADAEVFSVNVHLVHHELYEK